MKTKHQTIIAIYMLITEKFGLTFFDVTNFWDADNYAIGLKKKDKLIYISTWKYRNRKNDNMRYYVEFEEIEEDSAETQKIHKIFEKLTMNEVLVKINEFIC